MNHELSQPAISAVAMPLISAIIRLNSQPLYHFDRVSLCLRVDLMIPLRTLVLGLLPVFGVSVSQAADWPRFLGDNGTAVAEADTPIDISEAKVAWKKTIPGVGHASPIVVNDKIFLQSASPDGSRRSVLAFDAKTGEELWARHLPGSKARTHQKNTLASSTCASDGERLFALVWDGQSVTLHAFDMDGKDLWAKSLGSFASQHGAGTSPIVHDGKVFVNYDQDGSAEVFAFDAKTGDKLWSSPRRPFRASTSVPIIRDLGDGKSEVIFGSTAGLTAFNPADGTENWDVEWKFPRNPLRAVASPILTNNTLFITSGDGGGSRSAIAVEPGKEPKLLWSKDRRVPYVPCVVAKGDYFYWVADDGQASCANLKTGEITWTERVFNRSVTSSPIICGDKILAIAENGKAVVFMADPDDFDKVSETDLDEAVFASPAASNGRLFIRTTENLICYTAK